jgi:hypothetical protein
LQALSSNGIVSRIRFLSEDEQFVENKGNHRHGKKAQCTTDECIETVLQQNLDETDIQEIGNRIHRDELNKKKVIRIFENDPPGGHEIEKNTKYGPRQCGELIIAMEINKQRIHAVTENRVDSADD